MTMPMVPSCTISLHMDLTSEAREGAGWYLIALQGDATNEQSLCRKPIRITNNQAQQIASMLSKIDPEDNQDISFEKLIESGNRLIIQMLQKQIEFAENQARLIPRLRRTLSAESATVTDHD